MTMLQKNKITVIKCATRVRTKMYCIWNIKITQAFKMALLFGFVDTSIHTVCKCSVSNGGHKIFSIE